MEWIDRGGRSIPCLACTYSDGALESFLWRRNARQLEDSTGANFVDTVDFLRVSNAVCVVTWRVRWGESERK